MTTFKIFDPGTEDKIGLTDGVRVILLDTNKNPGHWIRDKHRYFRIGLVTQGDLPTTYRRLKEVWGY